MPLLLKPGDLILIDSPGIIEHPLLYFQKLWSKDNDACFTHCAVIVDPLGKAIDATPWKVTHTDIFVRYKKNKVLIARNTKMDNQKFIDAYQKILKHLGEIYPYHRLILHFLRIAKIFHWKKVVCSELVAQFLNAAGLRHPYWFGTTPDDLEEEFRMYRDYEIIYEGKL